MKIPPAAFAFISQPRLRGLLALNLSVASRRVHGYRQHGGRSSRNARRNGQRCCDCACVFRRRFDGSGTAIAATARSLTDFAMKIHIHTIMSGNDDYPLPKIPSMPNRGQKPYSPSLASGRPSTVIAGRSRSRSPARIRSTAPDDVAECDRRADPPKGDAGHPDDRRGA
jgi:hypothetical protein